MILAVASFISFIVLPNKLTQQNETLFTQRTSAHLSKAQKERL